MNSSSAWAIQSVEAPKAAMAGQNLNITPGTDITDVRVTFTNRTATVIATLVDETDTPLSASLVLMPRDETNLDPLGWGFRVQESTGSTNGVPHHTMWGVLPVVPHDRHRHPCTPAHRRRRSHAARTRRRDADRHYSRRDTTPNADRPLTTVRAPAVEVSRSRQSPSVVSPKTDN